MDASTGKIGLALMNDLTTIPTAPTVSLRVKQFADPTPTFTQTDDDVATGTRFGRQRIIQGVESGQKTIQATATLRDLPVLLQPMLAAPDGTGLITPRPGAFGALMPVQPVAIWQHHPIADALFLAFIQSLTINVPTRNTADVSVNFITHRVSDLTTLPTFPPLVSSGLVKFLNAYVKIGTQEIAPETLSLAIEQGMASEDGAQGLHEDERMYNLGATLDGPLTARLNFSINESGAAKYGGSLAGLQTLAKPNVTTGERGTQNVIVGFNLGAGQVIEFTLPNAELRGEAFPTGLGRIVASFTSESVNVGAPPVTAKVPVTP